MISARIAHASPQAGAVAASVPADEEDAPEQTLSDLLLEVLGRAANVLFEPNPRSAAPAAAAAEVGAEAAAPRPLRLPRADASPAALRGVGALLAKSWVEGICQSLPLAPTAVAALLGRLSPELSGARNALAHLSAWDADAAERLLPALLGSNTGGEAARGVARAAAQQLVSGREAALAALREGFAAVVTAAGLADSLCWIDEW